MLSTVICSKATKKTPLTEELRNVNLVPYIHRYIFQMATESFHVETLSKNQDITVNLNVEFKLQFWLNILTVN